MPPWSMMPTRSASASASSRYCVVRKTVTPSSRARGARGGREQGGEHVDRGGLAGAVRSQEPVDLARRDLQVDPVHGAGPLLELPDEALDLDALGLRHVRRPLCIGSA